MPAVSDDIRYTSDSLKLRDKIQERMMIVLRDLIKKRLFDQGRNVVTVADIRACLPDAIRSVMIDLQEEDGIESAVQRSE